MVVVVLSAVATALSCKQYERNRFHTALMGKTRAQIDVLVFPRSASKTTAQLRADAKKENDKDYSLWSNVKLYVLWLGLPIAIGILGVLVIRARLWRATACVGGAISTGEFFAPALDWIEFSP
ncbi:hypothetical protein [Agromyces sp. Soil535]|uniref:hypothetical protein n=1 Tax=Agromyces sp. Soil535 TaxID=1736390 RepID=UPI0006F6962B|nr:hypothetical protein [Agromyces sp. Soil535]KRE28538.1 hypothetical protein ASG80_21110 [Agromyces sp. Soil535]